jgi:hypothetical protein
VSQRGPHPCRVTRPVPGLLTGRLRRFYHPPDSKQGRPFQTLPPQRGVLSMLRFPGWRKVANVYGEI